METIVETKIIGGQGHGLTESQINIPTESYAEQNGGDLAPIQKQSPERCESIYCQLCGE